MKKLTVFIIMLTTFCAPVHAIRLKHAAKTLESNVGALAKSHNRLWRLAGTLQEKIRHIEQELKKQTPGTVSLVKKAD